jgi:hypothetical protein
MGNCSAQLATIIRSPEMKIVIDFNQSSRVNWNITLFSVINKAHTQMKILQINSFGSHMSFCLQTSANFSPLAGNITPLKLLYWSLQTILFESWMKASHPLSSA